MPGTVDLLLRGAGQLITCRSSGGGPKRGASLADPGLVRDGAIAVTGGRIFATGSLEEVTARITGAEVSSIYDAEGRVVMPGWVDPHTHAVFSTYRVDEFEARIRGDSYLEIERRGGGIKRTVRGVREMGEDQLFDISVRRIKQMIEQGTTTIEIKSGYGLDLTNELKMLRVIARLAGELPIDVVPTFMGAQYVRVVTEEMIPAVALAGLARFCDVFCESGVFDLDDTRTILESGKRAGLGAKVHADEITSMGGAELAVDMDAVSAEHLVAVSHGGIERLAGSETIAVLLPATTFGLASRRFAPARELVSAGAAVALATDFNPGSAPSNSMPFAVAIACSQRR